MKRLIDTFEPGDLVYGFREDLEIYIMDLRKKFADIQCFSQSHLNKSLVVADDDHMAHVKDPSRKEIRAYHRKGYGSFNKESVDYKDSGRASDFYQFLIKYYRKYDITETTGQCVLFKRICKQGIIAVKMNGNKIHFLLDDVYNRVNREKHIIEKGKKSSHKCQDCDVDTVTGSELRSIYRNWDELKNTVIFWYADRCVDPPWVDKEHSALWLKYKPKSWKTLPLRI